MGMEESPVVILCHGIVGSTIAATRFLSVPQVIKKKCHKRTKGVKKEEEEKLHQKTKKTKAKALRELIERPHANSDPLLLALNRLDSQIDKLLIRECRSERIGTTETHLQPLASNL
ncbi:hypothetical protein JRQ81_019068 [Phrynocephalus forsythii]|uniref:Uncharacterized protein n=1 Tax=Phrynocephalus forsythii TaxID=171643 RepID=A0A9Q0XMA4_9SAUR|nr:hypothetical protein JRQ81_019068 [Phrynocephalus forsythii]